MNISENINLNNVHDSNLFLRKLWSELEKGNGWLFSSIRNDNNICIGQCNYGKVSFDYSQRGCIKNIYFSDVSCENVDFVQKAITRAKKIEEIKTYFVLMELPFLTFNMKNELFSPEILQKGNKSYLYFKVNAYSQKDLKYLLGKKREAIRALFSVYVRRVFPINSFKISYSSKAIKSINSHCKEVIYDRDWVDLAEMPRTEEGHYLFPQELLVLIDEIVDRNFYSNEINMLLNAAHAYHSATYLAELSIKNNIDMIGCANIANSIVISALEPLAALENVPTSVCEKCGADIYSVVKKIKMLLERYLTPNLAKYIVEEYYSKRSKFFHEGIRESEEYYTGICWPQINETDGRSILMPQSLIAFNLFDWVSLIIRKRIFDIIECHVSHVEIH